MFAFQQNCNVTICLKKSSVALYNLLNIAWFLLPNIHGLLLYNELSRHAILKLLYSTINKIA